MSKVHIARQGFLTKSALPVISRAGGPSANASLLLLGDGTNGSTSIIDSSVNALTVTRIGTPTISTTTFPTGMTSSINLPGTTSYLRVDHSALFNFAADFTIEMYVNYSAHANFGGLFSAAGSMFPGWTGLQMVFNGTADTVTVQGNQNTLLTSSSTLSRNAWNHVALSRVSGVMRLYFNGVEVASANNSTSYTNNSAFVYVGSERSPGGNVTGYFSNVRVLNTIGLYAANFTPPALPMANSATALLTNNTYGVYQNY